MTRARFAAIADDRLRRRSRRRAARSTPFHRAALHLVEHRGRDLAPSAPWRRAGRRPREISVTSLSFASKPMSVRETSLKTKRSTLLSVELGALRARAPPRRARRAKPTMTWPSRAARASVVSDVVVGSSSSVHGSRVLRALCRATPRPAGSRRRPRPSRRRRRPRVRERLALERLRPSASRRPRRPPARATPGSRRAASRRRRAGAPPRRARRPSGRTSGCRRSGRRRAARACRPPRRARACRRACRRREQLLDAAEDLLRLGHPPHAELALGELALVRARSARRLAPRSVAAFACVAGCSHMRGFIAGATSTGPRCASAASVRTLSAMPCASFASVFAVHGATTSRSARSGADRGPRARAGARARRTSRAATNCSAPGVRSGTTSCPALTSSRASSQAL